MQDGEEGFMVRRAISPSVVCLAVAMLVAVPAPADWLDSVFGDDIAETGSPAITLDTLEHVQGEILDTLKTAKTKPLPRVDNLIVGSRLSRWWKLERSKKWPLVRPLAVEV
jgi:hypothetical protein